MLMKYSVLRFFFFFQAEDGIRDIGVTGVQTCALPIYAPVFGDVSKYGVVDIAEDGRIRTFQEKPAVEDAVGSTINAGVRSEERRVGKECRFRRKLVP